eukprot:95701_1
MAQQQNTLLLHRYFEDDAFSIWHYSHFQLTGYKCSTIAKLYNEPTQGLYFVNQHLEIMGPRLIKTKHELDSIRQKLATALTDVTEDIEAVDKILSSQCNLASESDQVQQLRHDYGHSTNRKRTLSRGSATLQSNNNETDKK